MNPRFPAADRRHCRPISREQAVGHGDDDRLAPEPSGFSPKPAVLSGGSSVASTERSSAPAAGGNPADAIADGPYPSRTRCRGRRVHVDIYGVLVKPNIVQFSM
jgi:hypothetical protein